MSCRTPRVGSGVNPVASLAWATLSSLVVSACIADPEFASGAEMAALLGAYQAQSAAAIEAREAGEQAALKLVRIDRSENARQPVLSVDLEQADFSRVLEIILDSPLVEYRAQRLRFSHRVSARFDQRPLAEGLNILLEGSGLYATWDAGLLNFHKGRGPDTGPAAGLNATQGEAGMISREIALNHLASGDVVDLISNLFATDEDETVGMSVGSVPELNTIFVSGPSDTVAEAVSVVRQADRPVAHVIIEALVVNIDTSSVESLAINLSDGGAGKFDLTTLIPAQTGGNLVAAFSDLSANAATITATVDFLAAQNAAEILARPYVATRSTQPATIAIVDDQFARVDTSGDDSSIITTDSITAGISMQITPLVMADNAIRMDISLEDSRFAATAGDIIIAKERSSTSTSMIVQSGQTILLGGLNSRYRLTDKSGFPWLRHIPILNLFTREQSAVESREELLIYLTPYIWVPGLDTPLPLAGHPAPELPRFLSIENGGRAVD